MQLANPDGYILWTRSSWPLSETSRVHRKKSFLHVITFETLYKANLCPTYSPPCTQGNQGGVLTAAMVSRPAQVEDAISIQFSCFLRLSLLEKWDGNPPALENKQTNKSWTRWFANNKNALFTVLESSRSKSPLFMGPHKIERIKCSHCGGQWDSWARNGACLARLRTWGNPRKAGKRDWLHRAVLCSPDMDHGKCPTYQE